MLRSCNRCYPVENLFVHKVITNFCHISSEKKLHSKECSGGIPPICNMRVKKGGYLWIDGILFHHDEVLNQSMTKSVVPSNRRAKILSFAHDNSFHQGHKKLMSVFVTLFWLTLRSDVIHHVAKSKWQSGVIVDLFDEYSYLVEFSSGAR